MLAGFAAMAKENEKKEQWDAVVDAELTEVCVFAVESGGRFGAKATELMDLVARKSTSDKQLQAAFRRY